MHKCRGMHLQHFLLRWKPLLLIHGHFLASKEHSQILVHPSNTYLQCLAPTGITLWNLGTSAAHVLVICLFFLSQFSWSSFIRFVYFNHSCLILLYLLIPNKSSREKKHPKKKSDVWRTFCETTVTNPHPNLCKRTENFSSPKEVTMILDTLLKMYYRPQQRTLCISNNLFSICSKRAYTIFCKSDSILLFQLLEALLRKDARIWCEETIFKSYL